MKIIILVDLVRVFNQLFPNEIVLNIITIRLESFRSYSCVRLFIDEITSKQEPCMLIIVLVRHSAHVWGMLHRLTQ